jgi:hypothetical protein
MLGVVTDSTIVIIIPASNDWVIRILTCCFWISTIVVFDTSGGVMLTRDQWSSSLRLTISIHCGTICGCEYPFGSLLLVKIDGWIYWLCGPN